MSKHWIDSWGEDPPLSEITTDVRALLAAELANPSNWSAQLPSAGQSMATLAPDRGETATLAHPLGRFVFVQRVVPFGLDLSRFGAGGVSGPNRFDPIAVTVGGNGLTPPLVQEHFARAQFVEMSDDEKLTRPSFEALDAGVAFSSEAFTVPSVAIGADMDFEPTAYLDLDPARYNRTRRDPSLRGAATDHSIIGALALLGAAARAPMRVDERITAHTAARVDVEAAPLVAVADDTFVPAADVLVPRAEMTAEQQLPLGTLLVEAFELAVG